MVLRFAATMLYDEDGNLLGYGFGDLDADNDVDVQDYNLARGSYVGRTFGWSAENRLQTVQYREAPDVRVLMVLRYDYMGRRIEKIVMALDNQGQPTVREVRRFLDSRGADDLGTSCFVALSAPLQGLEWYRFVFSPGLRPGLG